MMIVWFCSKIPTLFPRFKEILYQQFLFLSRPVKRIIVTFYPLLFIYVFKDDLNIFNTCMIIAG